MAYEKTGYDTKDDSRLPDLLPEWSVRRLVEAGATAIKILLYYNPVHPEAINVIKKAFVERIGAECQALDVPFFLEVICYNDALGDAKGLEFARAKPGYVTAYMKEFFFPATAWTSSRSRFPSIWPTWKAPPATRAQRRTRAPMP